MVTAAQIAQLRRMVAEPSSDNGYTDTVLSETIARCPVADAAGELPAAANGSANSVWTPTYDLNAAAAEVWREKVAALAAAFDFSADGASYQRSQAAAQAMRMVQFYQSRRFAGNVRLRSAGGVEFNDE
jgi:hypothetical protein